MKHLELGRSKRQHSTKRPLGMTGSVNWTKAIRSDCGRHRSQRLEDVVQVVGRGSDAAVAQLLGADTNIDPFRSQLGGMGVPQPMRMHPLMDACLNADQPEESAHIGGRQAIAAGGAEHGMTAVEPQPVTSLHPGLQIRQTVGFGGHDP
jgi:hypothetical protein